MKVLLISFVRRGGMAHYNSQVANALSQHIKTSVLTVDTVPDSYFSEKVEVYKVKGGVGPRDTIKYLLDPTTYLKINSVIRKSHADIYHITSPHLWNLLLHFPRKSIVCYTIHDALNHSGEKIYYKFADQLFRSVPKYFLVHSEKSKMQLDASKYKQKNIFVVPHGDYSFLADNKEEIPSKEEDIILFFGRIEPYKGIDSLLKVAPRVFEELPTYRMIIAGDGDFSPYKDLIKDNTRIEIINRFIDDDEVSTLFRKSKMVVLPYKDATHSGVVHVSFAFKKPVIATNVGDLQETIRDRENGILIPPQNEKELINAILFLAKNDKARLKIGENGYNSNLKWNKIINEYVVTYENILTRN